MSVAPPTSSNSRSAIAPSSSTVAEKTVLAPMRKLRRSRNLFRSFVALTDLFEKPIEWVIRICGWSSIIGILAIFVFIFKEAAPLVPKLDWIHFFTSTRWIPAPATGNATSFGALALLVGTFSVTFIALILAVPIGLGAAVYVSEFAKGKVKETLKIVIELLAAIPSIVWGFIGLMVLGPIVQWVLQTEPGSTWGRSEESG